MVNYFYHKTLEKWLKLDLLEILNYFVIKNGKVDLIKINDKYDDTKIHADNTNDIRAKISFIEKYVLTKHMIKKVLKHIVSDYNINWYELPHNSFVVKYAIKKLLKKKIKNAISMSQ